MHLKFLIKLSLQTFFCWIFHKIEKVSLIKASNGKDSKLLLI